MRDPIEILQEQIELLRLQIMEAKTEEDRAWAMLELSEYQRLWANTYKTLIQSAFQ